MELRTFQDVARELAEKYGVSYELVEAILVDWTRLLYESMRCDFNVDLFE